jgi:hypothetical protein
VLGWRCVRAICRADVPPPPPRAPARCPPRCLHLTRPNCDLADTWQNFYLNDPTYNRTLTPGQEALLLGGSLSQWGEQVDAANIESRIWPRASGGAERMWSAASLRDVAAAEGRIDHMRCHMVQRGIGAGPIRPSSEYGYCPLPGLSRFHAMHHGA